MTEQMDSWVCGWMNACVNEWMEVGEWMGGWMSGQI